jgi:hypothetical protein
MAGAAVTMLKAFFKGSFVIPDPVVPNEDGTALAAYEGPALTVEGELNKLASNIALGRDTAGVHYRSDGDLGIVLGEELAISVLKDLGKRPGAQVKRRTETTMMRRPRIGYRAAVIREIKKAASHKSLQPWLVKSLLIAW